MNFTNATHLPRNWKRIQPRDLALAAGLGLAVVAAISLGAMRNDATTPPTQPQAAPAERT